MSGTNKIVDIILAVVVVLAVIVIASVWYLHANSGPGASGVVGVATTTVSNTTSTPLAASSTTRSAVPSGATAPNAGATALAGVAIPVVQGAGDPSGNVDFRSFNISIQGDAFSPDTVIVNQGDTINLEITAVDANYSFTQPDYGFDATITKGKTQKIQFQALQSGNFIFYCSSCGGPSKGPVGHLIVVASST